MLLVITTPRLIDLLIWPKKKEKFSYVVKTNSVLSIQIRLQKGRYFKVNCHKLFEKMLVPFKQVKFFPFEKILRNSRPELFLVKGVLKIYSKFTGEHPCRSATSTKLKSNLIEIPLRHGCSTVNVLHISRTPFPRNNSGCQLLNIFCKQRKKIILRLTQVWKLVLIKNWESETISEQSYK